MAQHAHTWELGSVGPFRTAAAALAQGSAQGSAKWEAAGGTERVSLLGVIPPVSGGGFLHINAGSAGSSCKHDLALLAGLDC